jgi:hypothetical protein
MMLDLDGISKDEEERICLESIEKTLEEILTLASARSAEAQAELFETFPKGAKRKIVHAVGFDPNGGTGVTKLEEECVRLEEIETMMGGFLAGVRQRLASIRGETDEICN